MSSIFSASPQSISSSSSISSLAVVEPGSAAGTEVAGVTATGSTALTGSVVVVDVGVGVAAGGGGVVGWWAFAPRSFQNPVRVDPQREPFGLYSEIVRFLFLY